MNPISSGQKIVQLLWATFVNEPLIKDLDCYIRYCLFKGFMIDLVPNNCDLFKVKGTLNKQQNLLRAMLTSDVELYR